MKNIKTLVWSFVDYSRKLELAMHIKEHRFLSVGSFCSVIVLFVFIAVILHPLYVKPNMYEADAATGTATMATTSLSLSTTNNSASVDVTPNNKNGTFASSPANKSASFSVTTNNYTGYNLSITASSNTGRLTNAETGGYIDSISSATSKADFSANDSNAASSYSNKWGYKPSKYVDTTTNAVIDNTGDSAVFLPSPTATATLLNRTTTANTASDNYTIALGIRADFNTKPGTYTNTFNLVAISNPISYTINYDKNTTDTVTNFPTRQSSSTSETTIALSSTIPTRAHYSFIGWCSTTTTSSNGIDSCTGAGAVVYNPNGAGTNLTYGIDQTTENTTTLYAMWKIDTFTCTKRYRLENVDGTWSSYTPDDTETINYGGTCNYSKTVTNYKNAANGTNGSTASTSVSNIEGDVTLSLDLYRNTFTCSKQYRLENADGTWGDYTPDGSETVRYGSSCSYSKTVTNYKNAANGTNGSTASTSVSNIEGDVTLSLDLYRNTFTCSKQYRLENADGTWGDYTPDGSETVRYGSSCSYSKTVANYKNAANGTNGSTASTSASNVTSDQTLSLIFYRNTFTCYIRSRFQDTNGNYTGWTVRVNTPLRYGQTCAWSLAADATYKAVSYSATITGTISQSLNIDRQTYYLTVGRDASYISSVSGAGYYRVGQVVSISATDSTDGEFTSWSQTAGAASSFGDTAAASTTFTMPASNATVYANGKNKIYIQDVTKSTCSTVPMTVYDKRDGEKYTIQKLADGNCWLLDNLHLDLSTTRNLTTANTNIAADWTAPLDIATWSNSYDSPKINADFKNRTSSYYGVGGYKEAKFGIYYNYCAATAGTYCYSEGAGTSNASYDICPKGWHIPTGRAAGEYQALYEAYNSNYDSFVNALRVPVAGFYVDNGYYTTLFNVGIGIIWASTYNNNGGEGSRMDNLEISESTVHPYILYSGEPRTFGHNVRCVAK